MCRRECGTGPVRQASLAAVSKQSRRKLALRRYPPSGTCFALRERHYLPLGAQRGHARGTEGGVKPVGHGVQLVTEQVPVTVQSQSQSRARVPEHRLDALDARPTLARLLAALRLPAGSEGDSRAGARTQRRSGVRGVQLLHGVASS